MLTSEYYHTCLILSTASALKHITDTAIYPGSVKNIRHGQPGTHQYPDLPATSTSCRVIAMPFLLRRIIYPKARQITPGPLSLRVLQFSSVSSSSNSNAAPPEYLLLESIHIYGMR